MKIFKEGSEIIDDPIKDLNYLLDLLFRYPILKNVTLEEAKELFKNKCANIFGISYLKDNKIKPTEIINMKKYLVSFFITKEYILNEEICYAKSTQDAAEKIRKKHKDIQSISVIWEKGDLEK